MLNEIADPEFTNESVLHQLQSELAKKIFDDILNI